MSDSPRRRRSSDDRYPAYFTRGSSSESFGWPFVAALVAVIVLSLLAAVLVG